MEGDGDYRKTQNNNSTWAGRSRGLLVKKHFQNVALLLVEVKLLPSGVLGKKKRLQFLEGTKSELDFPY
jgi:hypothetical protein